ncbi:MAG: hypothetical protein RI996_196, partial [Candidatus Parcubacteria bacterium]
MVFFVSYCTEAEPESTGTCPERGSGRGAVCVV